MNHHDLCADCRSLLTKQNSPKHQRLVECSRITNYTIYRCSQCSAMLERTELPSRWQLLPIPFPVSSQRF